jgi:hypothetical protein
LAIGNIFDENYLKINVLFKQGRQNDHHFVKMGLTTNSAKIDRMKKCFGSKYFAIGSSRKTIGSSKWPGSWLWVFA